MTGLRDRLAGVPVSTLGFLQLALLQAGLDRVDPASERGERTLALVVLALAVAATVLALARPPGPPRPGSPAAVTAVRAGLLGTSVLLLLQVLSGAPLNPLVDLLFLVGVLLLAATTLPWADARTPVGLFLRRWSVPTGLTAVLLAVPLAAYRAVTAA